MMYLDTSCIISILKIHNMKTQKKIDSRNSYEVDKVSTAIKMRYSPAIVLRSTVVNWAIFTRSIAEWLLYQSKKP